MKHSTRSSKYFLFILFFFLIGKSGYSQNPDCDPTVPYFLVDLTGSPAGVWTSPNISRQDQCCGAPNSDQCISFDIILDTGAVGIQIDMTGADPSGSLYYSIGCAGSYPGGSIKCISGPGPHRVTFCKPGNNSNIYTITSISQPNFPDEQYVRIGCSSQLSILGVVPSSSTWQSVYPGAPGAYNSYLSCTNCPNPVYTPATTAPPYVDYYVCGFPQASMCGYNVTLCDTVRIYNIPQLSGSVIPGPATFCDLGPGSGVLLTASGAGGLPPFNFTWTNSSGTTVGTGPTYFASAAGNYTVEIGDSLNSSTCPSYFSTVTVNVGQIPVVTAGADQTVCATSPTVNLTGTVANATGIIWSGGAGLFNPGNTYSNTQYTPTSAELLAGSVTLTITSTGSSGSCPNSTDQVTIYFSDTLQITIPVSPLACYNSTTNLTANVSGGISPFSYQWNNGITTATNSVGQGNYSVVVTDAIGCVGTQSYNLIAPTALFISFTIVDVTVNGGSDGSVSASVSGGTPPYTYLWSPGGATTSGITGVPYGIYTVTVTDANGCTYVGSVVVNEPRCNGFNVTATSTNVSCYGGNNGAGSAIATGGTLPYTYSWNSTPVQTTPTANGLPAGVYTITVSDSNSCLQTANISITEPTMLTNVMTHTNPTTIGGSNGSATANPFGGTSPYTYLWSTGGTTQTITGLPDGTYYVTVTDANGCSRYDSVMVIEPPCDQIALSVVTSNIACYGGSTGVAFSVLTGATAPVNINWSNGQTGPTASGMPAGNYTVTISDSRNCVVFNTFTITQPSLLSAGASVNPISCYGLQDATIDISVVGGEYPYSYSWSNGATNEDLINLGAGTYTANITDNKGCGTSVTVSFTDPLPLTTSFLAQMPTCIFGTDGSIDFSVSGGVLPYSYLWSNGAITQDLSGISAGGYSVIMNDANGCGTAAPVIISVLQPDSVDVLSYTIACPVPGSGVSLVTVVPTGGDPGIYQISFDNGVTYQAPGDYDAYLSNGATYNIFVMDNSGCNSTPGVAIVVDPDVVISAAAFSNCFPIGTTNTNVSITVTGGDGGPYSISYDGGTTFQSAGTLSFNLPIGNTYNLIARDSGGCLSLAYTITIPNVLNVSAIVTSNFNGQNISCNGATNGSALATATGGSGSYSYSWSTVPSQTTAAAINLGAGTYTVTVTDGNGCTRTSSVTLTQPVALSSASATVTSNYNGQNISCNGASNGTASVTPTGGTAPYSYSWSTLPAQLTANANGLDASTYTVTVTDVNGCTSSATVTLTQPAAMSTLTSIVSNYNGQNISCNGANDGSVLAASSGGTSPYTYSWSTIPAQITATAINLGASTYTVNSTDINGCTSSATVTLSQPPVLSAVAIASSYYNGFNISCNGLSDGAIDVTTSGGTSPYDFSWNDGRTTEDISGLTAGTYIIIVTDANNCTATASATLTQADSVLSTINVLSNYNGYGVSCFNSSNGTIDINVSGGTSTYTYLWSNGATTQDISGLPSGTYMVIVTDANNCKDTMTTILTQPTALSIGLDSVSNYYGYNVSCFNSSNGSVYTTVLGGNGPYVYLWSNGATTDDIFGLDAGSYVLSVEDLNGCFATTNVALSQPSAFNSSYTFINPGCNGSANGSINFSLSGGVAPYVYDWSNGATSQDLINIGFGTYNLVYNDLNGCTDSISITLSEPLVLSNYIAQQNIMCYGDNNGFIDINIIGGTLPYTYLWSNGSTLEDVDSLSQGTYYVTITDAQGCSRTDTIDVTQPDSLSLTLNSSTYSNGHNITFYQGTDGSIDVTVTGGVRPYSYFWTNGQTAEDIDNLTAGEYSVIVTDQNGCVISGRILLTEPMNIAMPTGITPNNDGNNDAFVVRGIEAYPDNVLTIYNRWGNVVYQKENYLNEWKGTTAGGDELPEATYFAILEINGRDIVLNGYVEIRRK